MSSILHGSDEDDDEGDDHDEWESDDDVQFTGLLSEDVFTSVGDMIHHHREAGLNIEATLSDVEEHNIMMVNYIRRMVSTGATVHELEQSLRNGVHINDAFMRPEKEDDQLLFLINDYAFTSRGGFEEDNEPAAAVSQSSEVTQLREQVEKFKSLVKELTEESDSRHMTETRVNNAAADSELNHANSDDDDDEWESDDDVQFTGLLSEEVFTSVGDMIHHHREAGLNIEATLSDVEEHNIMMVNYIRRMVSTGATVHELEQSLRNGVHINDAFMRPEKEDDQLLFLINDYAFTSRGGFEEDNEPAAAVSQSSEVSQLREQVHHLRALVQELMREEIVATEDASIATEDASLAKDEERRDELDGDASEPT
jgi:K+-transporting ATPase c subunit